MSGNYKEMKIAILALVVWLKLEDGSALLTQGSTDLIRRCWPTI